MTTKNNIDELYSLIENSTNHHQTFIDNLDLWKSFYDDRFIIIKNNILNPKLFTIIEFLLEQEKGEIFEYFHSNIIKEADKSQRQLTFNLANSKQRSKEDIDELLNNLQNHNSLSRFLETLTIEDIFGYIKNYKSKELELETIDSLIISIHSQFFSLEPEVVKKIIAFIEKKLISLQNNDVKNNIMNSDLIFQYLNKIFPIKTFIGEDLEEDNLVRQIKNNQIKDKKLLLKFFKELRPEIIYEVFGEDLNTILTFLTEVDYIDEITKLALISILFDKMLKEDYFLEFLKLIIMDNQNSLWKQYLNSDRYNQIIIGSLNKPVFYMNSDMIKYLLTSEFKLNPNKSIYSDEIVEHTLAYTTFKNECQYLMTKKDFLAKNSDFDIEGVKQILANLSKKEFTEEELTITPDDSFSKKDEKTKKRFSVGLDIDFDTAIELLDKHMQMKNRVSTFTVQVIIRSIATEFQKHLGIENNGVYSYKKKTADGTFYPSYMAISINRELNNKFLDFSLPLYKRLNVFITMFHEIKHAKINQDRKDNVWTIDAYEMEKEDIVRTYDDTFYSSNYKRIKEEIEARISGYDSLLKFIETYFSGDLLDKIQNQILSELENEKTLEQEQNAERIMNFLGEQQIQFNIGFDILIRYNPNILKEHPILNLEYYPNGLPKTYEDIWLSRTEENKDLIDGILRIRYKELTNLTIKGTPKK